MVRLPATDELSLAFVLYPLTIYLAEKNVEKEQLFEETHT